LLDDDSPTQAAAPTATGAPVSTLVSFQEPTGERSTGARCWMVVIDESSSMSSADSLGTRADAVRATAEFLAAYGLDGDRIGETWFADDADVTPAAPTGQFAPSVAKHDVGSGTELTNALTAAVESMASSCAGAKPVLVLVSDGQASSQPDFDGIATLLTSRGGDVNVHLIAMNENAAFESARGFWEDPALGLRSITAVTGFGSTEVAAAVAGVLSTETGQQVVAK
jgi:Mg-chelatase subunit ChlD